MDSVHLSRPLDENGKVPLEDRSDSLAPGEPIYVSMEVTDAAAGSAIRAWTGEERLTPGHSHPGSTLAPSEFRAGESCAEIIIADETVAKRWFQWCRGPADLRSGRPSPRRGAGSCRRHGAALSVRSDCGTVGPPPVLPRSLSSVPGRRID